MKAQLIGERSGGMTAVEIYNDEIRENGGLVWSHEWFVDGCTTAGYIDGLCDAFSAMLECADYAGYDGGDVDEDGDPVPMDGGSTTGVMLEYDTDTGWCLGECARTHGQSREIVDACMAVGLIEPDAEHDADDDSEVVAAIVRHIKKTIEAIAA